MRYSHKQMCKLLNIDIMRHTPNLDVVHFNSVTNHSVKHIHGSADIVKVLKVKSESEAAQSCPTLSDPMDCSPPGSSVHGIFQARVLEWGAIAFSDTII